MRSCISFIGCCSNQHVPMQEQVCSSWDRSKVVHGGCEERDQMHGTRRDEADS